MNPFDPNLAFLWRAIERFANVLIGALAIYLGYKLFMNLPDRREDKNGELKLLLPGDISVYVSRVGPGVFFALFGTAVVLMSFVSSLVIDHQKKQDANTTSIQAAEANTTTKISYVSGEVDVDRFSSDRAGVQRDLVTLRDFESALNNYVETGNGPTLSQNDANTLINTLMRVKRLLLLSVWDERWGDAQQFAQWVKNGALDPPPAGLELVAQMYAGSLAEANP